MTFFFCHSGWDPIGVLTEEITIDLSSLVLDLVTTIVVLVYVVVVVVVLLVVVVVVDMHK